MSVDMTPRGKKTVEPTTPREISAEEVVSKLIKWYEHHEGQIEDIMAAAWDHIDNFVFVEI